MVRREWSDLWKPNQEDKRMKPAGELLHILILVVYNL